MLLESACDPADEACYALPITDDQPPQLDWRPLIRSICEDVQRGVAPAAIAMRFHRSLATAIEVICKRYSDCPVALCGGVFQNRILAELVAGQRRSHQQPLGLPGMIPPNDGGLAAGQLVIALSRSRSNRGSAPQ
jgi:hydrogenase maturation protein HypF